MGTRTEKTMEAGLPKELPGVMLVVIQASTVALRLGSLGDRMRFGCHGVGILNFELLGRRIGFRCIFSMRNPMSTAPIGTPPLHPESTYRFLF